MAASLAGDLQQIEAALASGRKDVAAALCTRALASRPDDPQLLTVQGELAQARGERASAVEYFRRVTALRPQDAAGWRRLGLAELEADQVQEAMKSLRTAIALDPRNPRAHNNLGRSHSRLGNQTAAQASYRQALAIDARNVAAHLNLGLSLLQTEDPKQALRHIEACLQESPSLSNAWCAHADALSLLGRPEQSYASAAKALALLPDNPLALLTQARALYELKRHAEALALCDRALAIRPDDALIHVSRGRVLRAMGDSHAARAAFESALRLEPLLHAARWSAMIASLPVLADTEAQMLQSRIDFDLAIGGMEEWVSKCEAEDALCMVGTSNPFHLAYQPCDNRELLARYGALCTDLMRGWQNRQRLKPVTTASGRRIGIVSAHICNHSVFNAIIRGWLQQLFGTELHICVFHLGEAQDAQTQFAREHAHQFVQGRRPIEAWANAILAAQLDVLVYPEIGLNENIVKLAAMRLAPVQCASWGHPETSGLPTLDYFLSAQAFEPAGSAKSYTEQLVCLPGLGVYYDPVEEAVPTRAGTASRESTGVPHLVCPGTPFKYLPQHDAVLVDIARRLGRCRFSFFAYEDGSISRRLLARISKAFTASGLVPDQYLELRPWGSAAEFHGVMRGADVMLDTIGFSGFNTVMQAVQTGLPVVTQRGEFMRGRLGSGILEQMGLENLVTATASQYVERAVELAEDSRVRRMVSKAMHEQRHSLYRDPVPVQQLCQFLLDPAQSDSRASS